MSCVREPQGHVADTPVADRCRWADGDGNDLQHVRPQMAHDPPHGTVAQTEDVCYTKQHSPQEGMSMKKLVTIVSMALAAAGLKELAAFDTAWR